MGNCLKLLLSAILLWPAAGYAFEIQKLPEAEYEKLLQEWQPLKVTGNAVSWDVFSETKEIEECSKDKEGFDLCLIKPEYGKRIRQLDSQHVTLMGFMFPLELEEGQHAFLLGPYPQSCPFHYHVGPAQVVEVRTAKPVPFTYDPITITGTFRLRYDEETGVFYYLEDAQ